MESEKENKKHLINKRSFNTFIRNNNKIPDCDKQLLLSLSASSQTTKTANYTTQNNNRIYLYIKNALEQENSIQLLYNMYLLLLHFTDKDTIYDIFKNIYIHIHSNMSEEFLDSDIIAQLAENPPKKSKADKKGCSDWNYSIQFLVNKYFKNYNTDLLENNTFNYLDIGCGSGSKTMIFGNTFKKLWNNRINVNINGTDIKSWGTYKNNRKFPFNFTFITNPDVLDYPDNSFDFITTIFTLHHIQHLEVFITEILRVLKPGGIVLIIEHNDFSCFDNNLFIIEHQIYSAIYDKRTDYIENPVYMTTYNKYEWNYIFQKNGFDIVDGGNDTLYFNPQHEIRYDKPFFAFYQKPRL